jgi:hypothetical protein
MPQDDAVATRHVHRVVVRRSPDLVEVGGEVASVVQPRTLDQYVITIDPDQVDSAMGVQPADQDVAALYAVAPVRGVLRHHFAVLQEKLIVDRS